MLVLGGSGLHAYVQYRRRGRKMPTSERWIYGSFSLVMLFGTLASFGALILAVMYDRMRGPFDFGLFSLLIFLVYVVFLLGATRRARL
jgi:hypothetical protein